MQLYPSKDEDASNQVNWQSPCEMPHEFVRLRLSCVYLIEHSHYDQSYASENQLVVLS